MPDAVADAHARFEGPLPRPALSGFRRMFPRRVSFSLHDTPVGDVFRALAAAMDVQVTIESSLPNEPVSMRFKDAPTPEVLNILCGMANCAWDFDPARGLRVMQKR